MKIKEKIQTYREYIRNYKFHSLFLKNLSLLLILILVPFTAASVIGYYAIKNMQQNNMNAYSQRLATEFYGDWKRILKEAEMELRYIGFSSNVELFFYDTEQLKQLNYSLRTVMEMIRMPVLAKNYVNSVYAYSEGSGKSFHPMGSAIMTHSLNAPVLMPAAQAATVLSSPRRRIRRSRSCLWAWKSATAPIMADGW